MGVRPAAESVPRGLDWDSGRWAFPAVEGLVRGGGSSGCGGAEFDDERWGGREAPVDGMWGGPLESNR